ncbi:hypothetical protein EDD90_6285 [Streptomyces sp. Ag109_O5-1]|nr:hypothetical protein EDD90_6285 [Streptomyces sp. Ag109_O5-1]
MIGPGHAMTRRADRRPVAPQYVASETPAGRGVLQRPLRRRRTVESVPPPNWSARQAR